MTELLEKLKTAITNACACVNVTCEITFPGGVIPAAVYDEDLVDQVRKTIGADADVCSVKFRFLLFEVVEVFSAATAVFSNFVFTEYFTLHTSASAPALHLACMIRA